METEQIRITDNQRLVARYKQFLAERQQKRCANETSEGEQRIKETVSSLKLENAKRGTPILILHI